MRRFLLCTTLIAASACTDPEVDELRAAFPNDRMLLDDAALRNAGARSAGEPSDYYLETMDAITDTNAGIGEILAGLDEITSFRPTWEPSSRTALWGPWLEDGLYSQLWMRGELDGTYQWALQIRPEQSTDQDWVSAISGRVEAGADETASTGRMQIDFTAIDGAGAGEGETGRMAVAYDIREDGAEVTLAVGQFAEDGSIPADGRVHYDYDADGGLFDFDVVGELNEEGDGSTLENLQIRSRWDATGAGRADARVGGGELGPLTYYEIECWDAGKTVVFTENNADLTRSGDAAACVYADASYPGE
ncbi:MAG: hypothetical protein H6738_20880 [Alphaproteobacteria bacterium]|nr:hypothetical protein [Alphaproteobacteria bacterium]MCB9699248.1 hypothetical protein [Alphaproteobacteria bacterium]